MRSLAPSAVRRPLARDPRKPPAISQAALSAAVDRGMARAGGRWEEETTRKRETHARWLTEWMEQLALRPSINWETLTPELLIGYLEGDFLPKHGRRALADGSVGPSHSYLAGAVSHLRTAFRLAGREMRWGTGPPEISNPADSLAVESYLHAYQKQHARAGHESVAARPMAPSGGKLRQLQAWLDAQIAVEGDNIKLTLLRRDQAVLALMASWGKRGKDCGKIRWVDITYPDGGIVDPTGYRPADYAHQRGLSCRIFDKTHQIQRTGPMRFEYDDSAEGRVLNFPWRLAEYVRQREVAGLTWGTWVFSPLARNRREMADSPLRADTFCQRLEEHLARSGLDEGETPHSLRRGVVQELEALGLSEAEVMARVGIESSRTLRLYADQDRPVRTRDGRGLRTAGNADTGPGQN